MPAAPAPPGPALANAIEEATREVQTIVAKRFIPKGRVERANVLQVFSMRGQ
jgi:hypothetical protein